MIVDCAYYLGGERFDCDATTAASPPPGAFGWIGYADPDANERTQMDKLFGIHGLAILDAIRARERPKVERIGSVTTVVLRTASYDEATEEVDFGQITVMVSVDFAVVVRSGQPIALRGVRSMLEADPLRLSEGPEVVLGAIVDRVVQGYDPVLDGIENDIDEVESQVFADAAPAPTERLYKLLREVVGLQRAIIPLAATIDRLAESHELVSNDAVRPFLADSRDRVSEAADRVGSCRDLLAQALDANLAEIAIQQNEDMRRMSAWAAMLAVPTMVAGIYGMNFRHMPELEHRWGYPAVIIVLVVIAVALHRMFRRSGWL